MKIFLLLSLTILIVCCNSTTQKPLDDGNKITQAEIDSLFGGTGKCEFDSVSEKGFSFESSLDQVLIVSYKYQRQGFANSDNNPEKQLVKDNKMVWNEFREQIVLKKSQISSLKKLHFNYTFNGSLLMAAADCYFPRHCIYFLDKNKMC